MRSRALSPPPMRRAKPPASTRPRVERHAHARFGLIVVNRGLAAVLGAFVLDISEVLIEHDAICAGKRNEALAAGAADQRQVRFAREFDAPGGEAGARIRIGMPMRTVLITISDVSRPVV